MALTQEQKAKLKELTTITFPIGRASYPSIFKPSSAKPADKKKYAITVLLPKSTDLKPIRKAIHFAKVAKWGKDEANWPEEIESPIVDGDLKKFANKQGYKGHWVIRASCGENSKPQVVDKKLQPIINPADVYPGCHVCVNAMALDWEYMGKIGVMFILNHVQKVKDDLPFSSKKPADKVFTVVEDDESDFADSSEEFAEDDAGF